jgi:hypothetical protein
MAVSAQDTLEPPAVKIRLWQNILSFESDQYSSKLLLGQLAFPCIVDRTTFT